MTQWTIFSVLVMAACSDPLIVEENPPSTTTTPTSQTDAAMFAPDHILQVAIEIDPADWDTLRNQERTMVDLLKGEDCMDGPFDSPYTYFHADVTIDGQSVVDIGVRKKGLIGSQSTTKPGLKLNIDEYNDGAEIFGIDNITLNNAVQDPALVRQCLGYSVFADAGIAAPRCNFAHLTVNGDDMGIYVHVEPVKRSFLRANFGDDTGDLYEGTLSDFRGNWVNTFDPKTSDTDALLGGPLAIKEALLATDDQLLEALAPLIDIDAFLNFWAVETLIGHWDGYAGNANNFYMYRDPTDDVFVFIPWGVDGVMQSGALEYGPFVNATLSSRLLDIPEAYDLFAAQISRLLDDVWDEDALAAEVDRMEDLLATEVAISGISDQIDDVRTFIWGRRFALLQSLPGTTYPLNTEDFCMTQIGSLDASFSTDWGSLNVEPDITVVGDLDMTLVWQGWEMDFVQQGVAAGTDNGQPLLVFAGIIDYHKGSLILPYFVFDQSELFDGAELSVTSGAVLYTENSYHGYLATIAYMADGSVSIETGSTGAGDAVTGTVSATLWGWPE